MAIDRSNDPRAFRDFLDAKISNGGANLTLDDALGLWEYENQTDEEREDTLRAIREGLADVDAGRVRPAFEALEELRRKHNLPPQEIQIGPSPSEEATPALEDLVDLDFEAFCAREGDDSITLQEVREATSKIPGSMAEAIIEDERAERF